MYLSLHLSVCLSVSVHTSAVNLGNSEGIYARFLRMFDFVFKVLITPESPGLGWFRPLQKSNSWNDVDRKQLDTTPPVATHGQGHSWTSGFIQLHD